VKKRNRADAGYTLAELLVTTAIVAITGGMLFVALQTISTLTAKNNAINFAHQQARQTMNRIVQQMHQSVSVPQLIDTSLTPLTGAAANGPAAGVSYQSVVAGPYKVWNNATAASFNIRITSRPGDPVPQPGMRLIVSAFQIEDDIVSVGGAAGAPPVRDIQLAHNLGQNITCNAGSPTYVAYYTQRSALVVVNKELRFYRQVPGPYAVVARNLTTPLPFSVPAGDNRFVKIEVVARDPHYTARGYKSVDLQMSLTVPYRYGLTIHQ